MYDNEKCADQQGYHPDLAKTTAGSRIVGSPSHSNINRSAAEPSQYPVTTLAGALSGVGASLSDYAKKASLANQAGDARALTEEERIDKLFTYQSPTPEQLAHLADVREGAKAFAKILLRHVPAGADRTAAIRKLRELTMTANAAIVLNGLSF